MAAVTVNERMIMNGIPNFEVVNCTVSDGETLESQLSGRVKSAFIQAHGSISPAKVSWSGSKLTIAKSGAADEVMSVLIIGEK
jgi:sigma54-dependent transcription regulator